MQWNPNSSGQSRRKRESGKVFVVWYYSCPVLGEDPTGEGPSMDSGEGNPAASAEAWGLVGPVGCAPAG